MGALPPEAEALLGLWIGDAARDPAAADAKGALWYGADPATDADLGRRFGALVERALRGELDAWARTARGRLALVILLDQLTRNLHRGTARAFAGDARALALTLEGLTLGADRELGLVERAFLLHPLEHAEDLAAQQRCVDEFAALAAEVSPEWRTHADSFLDYARRHRDIIARFGRFPYRNTILGRTSTSEEGRWLESGESFGQAAREPS